MFRNGCLDGNGCMTVGGNALLADLQGDAVGMLGLPPPAVSEPDQMGTIGESMANNTQVTTSLKGDEIANSTKDKGAKTGAADSARGNGAETDNGHAAQEVKEVHLRNKQRAAKEAKAEQLRRMTNTTEGLSDSRQVRVAAPMAPEAALLQLIRNVQLRPDGGIRHLSQDLRHEAHEESDDEAPNVSKIRCLQKAGVDIPLAIISILRAIMNPLFIIFFDGALVLHYYFGRESALSARIFFRIEDTQVGKPLAELVAIVSIVELSSILLYVIWMLIDVIHVAIICLWWESAAQRNYSHVGAPLSKRSRTLSNKPLAHGGVSKYMLLASIFWVHLPRLQNWSNLRALALVHPELVHITIRQMQIRDAAARAVLECFLGMPPDLATDEEIIGSTVKVMLQYSSKYNTNSQRMTLASEYMRSRVYNVAMKLMDSHLGHARLEPPLNAQALSLRWRLNLLVALENLVIGSLLGVLLVVGFSSFLVKLCLTSFIFLNRDRTWIWMILYMIALLNQVISILPVNKLLKERVERFAFGSHGAVVPSEERCILQVYSALLAEQVWESRLFNFWQKLAIMIRLDDDDLQQFIVEEDQNHKMAVMLCVKKYLSEHGLLRSSWLLQWVRGSHYRRHFAV